MSTSAPTRRNKAGWPITGITKLDTDTPPVKPDPIIAIESDAPDVSYDFLAEVAAVDETWAATVPAHLKETYLGLAVPSDVATMAVHGSVQEFEVVDIDPMGTDVAELNRLKRQSTGRTPGPRETVHLWRLNEASRLLGLEQMKQQLGYYGVDCPSCGGRTYASRVGSIQAPDGRTFTGCDACRDAFNEELQHRQREADPYLIARRQAVAAAFGEVTP